MGFHRRAGTEAVRFVLDLLASIAETGGFTLYFLHSKRVKATFVRHYSPRMRRSMRSSTALGS